MSGSNCRSCGCDKSYHDRERGKCRNDVGKQVEEICDCQTFNPPKTATIDCEDCGDQKARFCKGCLKTAVNDAIVETAPIEKQKAGASVLRR
jgi:hypothetical protein